MQAVKSGGPDGSTPYPRDESRSPTAQLGELAMTGTVEASLVDGIREKGCVHLVLIDPEKFSTDLAAIVTDLEEHGTSAIMVGGSILKSATLLDRTVKTIRDSCSLPTILFPNGPVGIS